MSRAFGLLFFAVALSGCPSTIDSETARAYPCDRASTDESQCPGGWYCGVEGFCYSRAAEDGAAYVCESDADCAETWRCGHGETCQKLGEAGAYACADDTHCEAGWRCGPDFVCVDPTGDALPEVLSTAPLDPTVLGRYLDIGFDVPDRFAVSPPFSCPGCGPKGGTSIVIVDEGRVAMALHGTGAAGAGGEVFLATEPLATLLGGDEELRALATARGRAYFLTATKLVVWNPVAATRVQLTVSGFSGLYVTHDTDANTLVFVYTSTALWATTVDGGALVRVTLPTDSGELLDVASLTSKDEELPMLLTTKGIWVSYRTAGQTADALTFEARTLPRLGSIACGVTRPAPARRVFVQPGAMFFELNPDPTDGVVRVVGYPMPAENRPSTPPSHCQSWDLVPLFHSVPSPCGSDPASLEGFLQVRDAAGNARFEARCADDSAFKQTPYWYRVDSNTFTRPFGREAEDDWKYLRLAVAESTSSVSTGAMRGDGRIWAHNGFDLLPVNLDRAPPVVLGGGAGLIAFDGAWTVDGASGIQYARDPVLGFVRAGIVNGTPLTAVENTRDWFVLDRPADVISPRQIEARRILENGGLDLRAVLPAGDEFKAPYRAVMADLGEGRKELVISSYDALLSAEIDLTFPVGEPDALDVRAVPLSRSPILSFAVLPPKDGVRLAGYVLTRASLHSFEATHVTRWRTEEIHAPDGEWVEVWLDGEKGRLGYNTGEIYGLPSRTKIAGVLPDEAVAVDFAQVCGQPFVATTTGMFRLVRDPGAVIGSWEAVAGFGILPGESPKLHVDGNRIYFFGTFGHAAEYSVTCP